MVSGGGSLEELVPIARRIERELLARGADDVLLRTPPVAGEETSGELLERAVEIQPDAQKGLWLLGMGHAQRGDDAFAISYWQSLMALLQPGSNIAATVQAQIEDAEARLGMSPTPTPVAEADTEDTTTGSDDGWSGTRLVITAIDGAQAALDQGVAGSDGHIVEQAETHALGGQGGHGRPRLRAAARRLQQHCRRPLQRALDQPLFALSFPLGLFG